MTKRVRSNKTGCGCNKSFRLWGGKRNGSRRYRRKTEKRKMKKILGGFVVQPTYPFSGVSTGNTIPLSGGNGASCDPTTPANLIDARQTNLF